MMQEYWDIKQSMLKTAVDESGCVYMSYRAEDNLPDGDDRMWIISNVFYLNVEQSKALYEQLKAHYEPKEDNKRTASLRFTSCTIRVLPKEPEASGVYVSQSGKILRLECDGDWTYLNSPFGELLDWDNGEVNTDDWNVVVDTLGKDEFPIQPLNIQDLSDIAHRKTAHDEED